MSEISTKALQQSLKKVRTKLTALKADENNLITALQGKCDHSETVDYTWKFDNGYGREHPGTGKRCVFCGWQDPYNRGDFHLPYYD